MRQNYGSPAENKNAGISSRGDGKNRQQQIRKNRPTRLDYFVDSMMTEGQGDIAQFAETHAQ